MMRGDEFAGFEIARLDRAHVDRGLALVESQVGLTRGAVSTVASKAVFRQDRSDVLVVAERLLGGRVGTKSEKQRPEK